MITRPPFNHPPDPVNFDGVTPLLTALNLRSLESALALLEFEVDVNRPHAYNHLTPMQLLLVKASSIKDIHLDIVVKLLSKGSYLPR